MFKKAKKNMSMMEIPKKQLNVYKYFTQSGKKMFNIPETMHTHSHICQMYANTCMCTSYTYMYTCTQIYTRQIDVVHMSNLPWMHTIPLSFLIWTTFFTSFATTTGTIGPLGNR